MSVDLSYAPSRAVFIRRSLILSAITFGTLLAAGGVISASFAISPLWALPTAALLTAGFVLDDVMRWRNSRFDRWQIHDGHFIQEGQDGSTRIPLDEISDVFSPFGNRVVIELETGERIAMRYLPYPNEVLAQIRASLPNTGAV